MTELQPLSFGEIQNNGKLAVYQARLEYPDVPGAPVFALTATTAAPASTEEKTALLGVLNQIRAGFAFLSEPIPEELDDTPDLFDPQTDIRLEPSLISIGRPGPVSIAATVEATTGTDKPATAAGEPRQYYTVTVPQNRDHHWHSMSSKKTRATVTVGKGDGTVSPPTQQIGPGPPHYATGSTVVVHGFTSMEYTLNGSFKYPPR
jgi:hypothetical protein